MLWFAIGYTAVTYAYALWTKLPAYSAVALANSGYVAGTNVYAVALAFLAVSPVYAPLAATFLFFARRPAAAARWGTRIGVLLVQQPETVDARGS